MKRWVCSLLLGVSLAAGTAEAKPVPNLKFVDLAGHPEELSGLRGKIRVVNFWATWCGPCQEELPRFSKLKEHYAGQGVGFLLISADEGKNRAKVEAYLHEHEVGIDSWIGAGVDMLDRLGLGDVLPATLILDEKGEVIARVKGEARDEDIQQPLEWLLHGRQGAAPAAVVKRY